MVAWFFSQLKSKMTKEEKIKYLKMGFDITKNYGFADTMQPFGEHEYYIVNLDDAEEELNKLIKEIENE